MNTFEVRRVHAHWDHPTDASGRHIPLRDGLSFAGRVRMWEDGVANWTDNYFYREGVSYEEWAGSPPTFSEHMPNWQESDRTHLMMYRVRENAGVPISPTFKTPEELSVWLAENYIYSDFGIVRNYDDWLEVATSDDVEDDEWYDFAIKQRAALNAIYKGDVETGHELARQIGHAD